MATSIAIKPPSVMEAFGARYGVDANKVMEIVSTTVFKQSGTETPLNPAEVAAALIVCNQYNLNPFLKEIYCFRSKGKLLIIVGIDGWSAIVNRQESLDGIEFDENFDADGKIESVTCRIWRKDRKLPIVVTEYWRECKRDTDPWRNMPIRMTRNRSFAQCARIAFSIGGIIDEDEAQTIEGYPAQGSVVDQSAWTGEQTAEANGMLTSLNWQKSRQDSFVKQYASRPVDAIAYLRKEVDKLKRVTPKAEKQEPKPEPEPEPQQDAEPTAEPDAEKAVEW